MSGFFKASRIGNAKRESSVGTEAEGQREPGEGATQPCNKLPSGVCHSPRLLARPGRLGAGEEEEPGRAPWRRRRSRGPGPGAAPSPAPPLRAPADAVAAERAARGSTRRAGRPALGERARWLRRRLGAEPPPPPPPPGEAPSVGRAASAPVKWSDDPGCHTRLAATGEGGGVQPANSRPWRAPQGCPRTRVRLPRKPGAAWSRWNAPRTAAPPAFPSARSGAQPPAATTTESSHRPAS
ncbi:hypothetical protein GH733_016816 [Mirounga leonina]|nr:hypothetical protein GH733_016816 [Mirounga leonina]